MSRRKYYNHNDDGSAAVMFASWFTPNDKDGPGPGPGPRSKPVIKRSSAASRALVSLRLPLIMFVSSGRRAIWMC